MALVRSKSPIMHDSAPIVRKRIIRTVRSPRIVRFEITAVPVKLYDLRCRVGLSGSKGVRVLCDVFRKASIPWDFTGFHGSKTYMYAATNGISSEVQNLKYRKKTQCVSHSEQHSSSSVISKKVACPAIWHATLHSAGIDIGLKRPLT